jgi:hypothetical protein
MVEKNSTSWLEPIHPLEVEKNSPPDEVPSSLSNTGKKKRGRSKNYTPKQEVRVKHKDRRRVARHGFCNIINQNKLLLVRCGQRVFRCHMIKSLFSGVEMERLAALMDSCAHWEERDDVRGDRLTLITGLWNARGLSRSGIDPIHLAGLAGKQEQIKRDLHPLLVTLGEKITRLIQWKRPDIYDLLLKHKATKAEFGLFHLFMAPRGSCGLHKDRNDFLSVVVGV